MEQSDWRKSGTVISVNIQRNTQVFLEKIIEAIHSGLRCIYYHRTMNGLVSMRKNDSRAMSIVVNNILLEAAVVEWTKIFGSEKEDTHFSRIIRNKDIYKDFEECIKNKGLLSACDLKCLMLEELDLTFDEFDKYDDEMLKFRDKIIVHTDLDPHLIPKSENDILSQKEKRLDKYPKLDNAKESFYWLYEFIVKLLESKIDNNGNFLFILHTRDTIDVLTNSECDEFKDAFYNRKE